MISWSYGFISIGYSFVVMFLWCFIFPFISSFIVQAMAKISHAIVNRRRLHERPLSIRSSRKCLYSVSSSAYLAALAATNRFNKFVFNEQQLSLGKQIRRVRTSKRRRLLSTCCWRWSSRRPRLKWIKTGQLNKWQPHQTLVLVG